MSEKKKWEGGGEDQSWYSSSQTTLLEVMPLLTAPLSMMGSFLILWYLLWNHMQGKESLRQSLYHRLMVSLSLLDGLSSTSLLVLGPWVVPAAIPFTNLGRAHSYGACEAAGFLTNVLFGSMWLSGFLALYFVLLLRFEFPEESRVQRVLEVLAHSLAWLYPLLTGSWALSQDIMNPMKVLPGWCWLADDRPDIDTADFDYDNDTSAFSSSERGTSSHWKKDGNDWDKEEDGSNDWEKREEERGFIEMIKFGNALSIFFLFFTIVVSMTLIVYRVRRTEEQMGRHLSTSIRSEVTMSSRYRTKETSWQAIWYIGSFFVVYLPILVLQFIDTDDSGERAETAVFFFAFLTKTITPLQGFFNAVIFLRKKFWKRTMPGECFFFFRSIPLLGKYISETSDRFYDLQGQRRNSSSANSSNRRSWLALMRRTSSGNSNNNNNPNGGSSSYFGAPSSDRFVPGHFNHTSEQAPTPNPPVGNTIVIVTTEEQLSSDEPTADNVQGVTLEEALSEPTTIDGTTVDNDIIISV